MKFSWKICVSTLVISLIAAGLGGYVLLSALFSSTYQREAKNASEENRMLQYSFVAYWNTTVQDGGSKSNGEKIRQTALAMVNGIKGTELRFRLYSEEGNVYYAAGNEAVLDGKQRRELLLSVSEDVRGRMLVRTGENWELATVGSIFLPDGSVIYLESDRDVTALFADRREQYNIYLRWMAGLLLVQGLACYMASAVLLRPLRRLSRAARKIAGGSLDVRARVETGDEVGSLAADFNHMADNLERQFAELEDAARRQEDFIGSFAHELKTPLTSMIGYADMLRAQKMSEEERFVAANYIFQEGKRLESLSFKLLDLMVIRHGELQKRPVGTAWLCGHIEGLLKPSLESAGIVLKVLTEEEQVPMEPDLMKTVLMNLLDNGRKAIEEKGTLYLLGRREKDGFAFYVRDTGKGMPKEELARITEAFYMVDKSRARQQGGAGLGLSICAEIVGRHGGELSFRSAEGSGTIARVWLPAEEEGENV